MNFSHWLRQLHRWLGLTLALLLGSSALSGSLLVWEKELDALLNPTLLTVPNTKQSCIDPLILREQVQARFPNVWVNQVDLTCEPGRSTRFWLKAADSSELANDQVFVDPYSGAITGLRRWGDITQGIRLNLIPFIYRFHSQLLLGDIGKTVLGATALLWLLMTFSGFWLTLPRHGEQRWRRWLQVWHMPLKRNTPGAMFHWHRGLGLWFALLFVVFAWSGVGFTLKQSVYQPTMGVLGLQTADSHLPVLPQAQPYPTLSWERGLNLARLYMNQALAKARNFSVKQEFRLAYDPKRAIFHYRVTSSLDARQRGETAVWIDANSGAPVAWYLPSGEAAGDTLHQWLKALHMAEAGGIAYRLLATLTGMGLLLLIVLGSWQWLKRTKHRTQPRNN